ncbi:MAG: uroporphyrinogen decarboxylase [Bacteroidia bacterium]|jgi:uroporphyrinogen decarboxylase
MLKNDLLLRAARGEKVERTPVWMMRQAGRILPQYREVRSKMGGFKELVESPEFASEVTIQPVDHFGVDAAIIFSDILVIPEAMGLPYQMVEKQGPWFENTISTLSDIEKLKVAEADDVRYTIDAISLTKKELNGRVPIIGFAGAPWTIFSYMIEGSGSKTFAKAKKFLYTQPKESHILLEKIALSTINYLKGQIEAGADLVQVFDSWAGILSTEQYREFALPYISMICNAIDEVPITVFAKGAYGVRSDLKLLNCETIGLDWNMDPKESRNLVGAEKTLQGNIDPCVLYADDESIVMETEKMLKAFGPDRYIANLGHGIYPDMDPEKAKLFVDTVKAYRH